VASFRKRGNAWYYRYTEIDGKQHERKGCNDRRPGCQTYFQVISDAPDSSRSSSRSLTQLLANPHIDC
jgi:hypothetical protein